MGCAGRIANGVNTVYCSYATPGGHALVGARIYIPADQFDDENRRAALGIGDDVEFRTKPQLALDLLDGMVADGTMPPGCAGDEVYGRAGELPSLLGGQRGRVCAAGRLRLSRRGGARGEDPCRSAGDAVSAVGVVADVRWPARQVNAPMPGRGSPPPALVISC
jgi:DDE superfamily endonuclease